MFDKNNEGVKEFRSFLNKMSYAEVFSATDEEYRNGTSIDVVIEKFEELCAELPTIAHHVESCTMWICTICGNAHDNLDEANACCALTEVTVGMVIENDIGPFCVSAMDGNACWIRPIDKSSLGRLVIIDDILNNWRKV